MAVAADRESESFSKKYKEFIGAMQEISPKEEESLKHEQAATSMEQLVTWMCINGNKNALPVLEQMRMQILESRRKAAALVSEHIIQICTIVY